MRANVVLGSPRRLRNAKILVVLIVLALFAVTALVRYATFGDGGEPAAPGAASARSTNATPTTTAVPTVGSPLTSGLEAARAIVSREAGALASVASPQVVELAGGIEAGDEIIGAPRVTAPGPTQQTVRVPTERGHLDLVIALHRPEVGGPLHWQAVDVDYVIRDQQ